MELVARGYAAQDRKLVATDARNGLSFQDRCLQHIRNVPKDGITDPVSIGVVDRLEFVDVDERDAEGFLGDQSAIDRCRNLARPAVPLFRKLYLSYDLSCFGFDLLLAVGGSALTTGRLHHEKMRKVCR